jgi:hypothetical protein
VHVDLVLPIVVEDAVVERFGVQLVDFGILELASPDTGEVHESQSRRRQAHRTGERLA